MLMLKKLILFLATAQLGQLIIKSTCNYTPKSRNIELRTPLQKLYEQKPRHC